MRKRLTASFFIVIFVIVLISSGCAFTSASEPGWHEFVVTGPGNPTTDTTLVKSIVPKVYPSNCTKDSESEVRHELEGIVNSGLYNIAYIDTKYDGSCLAMAKIHYYESSGNLGRGYLLRMMTVKIDAADLDTVENELFVRNRVSELKKEMGERFSKAVEIKLPSDRLVLAEVYYY